MGARLPTRRAILHDHGDGALEDCTIESGDDNVSGRVIGNGMGRSPTIDKLREIRFPTDERDVN